MLDAEPPRRATSRLAMALQLLANLVPLAGVAFLGWQVFPLLLVYWCENVIAGLFAALRLLCAAPGRAPLVAKVPFALMFVVHFGFFAFVHLAVLCWLFAEPSARGDLLPAADDVVATLRVQQLHWAVLGLGTSHLVAFVAWLRRGEHLRTTLQELMLEPYRRVMVLHVTLIAGGALVQGLGNLPAALVALVAVKIAFDLLLGSGLRIAHVRLGHDRSTRSNPESSRRDP